MSASDDDDVAEDAQLKQLRTVWISMRDEEPSDRGLAQLMAAAREKASNMTPAPSESWWQRALAVLRRPPVLALASVMVLLGGALFISQRHEQMKSDSTIAEERDSRVSGGEGQRGPSEPVSSTQRERSSAGSGAASGPSEPTAVAPPPPPPPPETPAVPTQVKPPVATPARPRPAPTTTPTPTVTAKVVKENNEAKKPTPPEETPRDGRGELGSTTKLGTDSLEDTVAPAPSDTTRSPVVRPSPRPTVDPAPGQNAAFGSPDVAKKPAGKSDENENDRDRISQLVKQCESAAARSDCAAVRVLAGRIRSSDEATYKARILKNTQIARCLE